MYVGGRNQLKLVLMKSLFPNIKKSNVRCVCVHVTTFLLIVLYQKKTFRMGEEKRARSNIGRKKNIYILIIRKVFGSISRSPPPWNRFSNIKSSVEICMYCTYVQNIRRDRTGMTASVKLKRTRIENISFCYSPEKSYKRIITLACKGIFRNGTLNPPLMV